MTAKARNIRKRKVVDDQSSGDDEEDKKEIRAKLEVTKMLQKQRARASGVDVRALLQAPQLQSITEVEEEGGPSKELLEAYVKEKAADPAAEDPEMEKYIEQQLAKRLGRSAAKAAEVAPRSEEDDLYVIPENLRGQETKPQDVPGLMTTITEVPLSMNHKLKNIEETEAAKRRMLRGGMSAIGVRQREDEDASASAKAVLPRIAYPRTFGKEKEKEIDFRQKALEMGPRKDWKNKKAQAREL
eukprot:jgi/Botrbrau1/8920/Bobra.0148s0033.1